MPRCLSCGAVIVSDPKYCLSCKNLPISEKITRTCKNCGGILNSITNSCPQCEPTKIPPPTQFSTTDSQENEVNTTSMYETASRTSNIKSWLALIGTILLIVISLASLVLFSIDVINIAGYWIADIFPNKLLSNIGFVKEPTVEIKDQTISWTLYDSKGNEYIWSLPIDKSKRYVGNIWTYDHLNLYNEVTGETYSVVDFRPFVGRSFSAVIDDVYHNSHNDDDFLYEIEYIVSRLTTYSFEIGEYPRYAADTLVQGGGDCEDLAILIADMLRSSKFTRDWKIQLVYMDGNSPNLPLDMNHVILYVDNGYSTRLIEATSGQPGQDHYPYGIKGWFYDV